MKVLVAEAGVTSGRRHKLVARLGVDRQRLGCKATLWKLVAKEKCWCKTTLRATTRWWRNWVVPHPKLALHPKSSAPTLSPPPTCADNLCLQTCATTSECFCTVALHRRRCPSTLFRATNLCRYHPANPQPKPKGPRGPKIVTLHPVLSRN